MEKERQSRQEAGSGVWGRGRGLSRAGLWGQRGGDMQSQGAGRIGLGPDGLSVRGRRRRQWCLGVWSGAWGMWGQPRWIPGGKGTDQCGDAELRVSVVNVRGLMGVWEVGG